MTTVATDGRTMAADRMVCGGGGIKHGQTTKIFHADNGDVVGAAGDSFRIAAFVRWYNGDRVDPFEANPEDFEALVLKSDGTTLCFNFAGDFIVESGPHAAIGSGSGVALGALDAGASPVKAIEIASRRDIYTGGGVDELQPR